ncbi:MAG: iron-containing alcohol dehydrogenase [Pseudomonadota bacterium]
MTGDIIHRLISDRFRLPETGKIFPCPIDSIAIEPSLDGFESELLKRLRFPSSLAIICDANTRDALGARIAAAVPSAKLVVIATPKADLEAVDQLVDATRHQDAMVAVGSGTLNDIVKYASFRRDAPYAVFATAPSMNGYVTATASISRGGEKLSLPAAPPKGAFFDLKVLADAPFRLIQAGVGDSLCRSTAEVDWYLSHLVRGTTVLETPFAIQKEEEAKLLQNLHRLKQDDLTSIKSLVKLLVLGGLGMLIAKSSQPGSQGEHLISHYIDMLCRPHPGSLHGEQVGLTTRTMARLQHFVLNREQAPVLKETTLDVVGMQRRFGTLSPAIEAEFRAKALQGRHLCNVNERLSTDWTSIRDTLKMKALPLLPLESGLNSVGLTDAPGDLGIDIAFYRDAVVHARELRNRFTMLDIAADSGLLEPYLDQPAPH